MRTHIPTGPLLDVLFPKYRRRLLALILTHPDETFYVRQIARLTGVPAGSLHRELATLSDAGLIARTESGNQVRYQADRSCPIFEDLASIFRKTAGLGDVLAEALVPLADLVVLAFVFGSVAAGAERPTSDVDLMVIGDLAFPEVVQAITSTQESLRRHVNPVVMSAADFSTAFRENDRFVRRVMGEPKLFVIGDADELGKLVEDRSAQGTSG